MHVCLAGAVQQKHIGSPEVRGQAAASSVRLDLDGKAMVRQMLHQVRPSDLCFAKGTIFSTDSLVTRFTNSTFSTSAHSNCTAAMFGNASGLNNASRRVLKSVKKAELWNGSFDGAKAAAPDHARNAQR